MPLSKTAGALKWNTSTQLGGEKDTYEKFFYRILTRGKYPGTIKGFPTVTKGWCRHLKYGSEIDLRKHFLPSEKEPQKKQYKSLWFPMCEGSMVQFGTESQAIASNTGFPTRQARWCTGELKVKSLRDFSQSPESQGADKNIVVYYLGIAADEPARLARLDGVNKVSPLAAIGWTEADARKWCEENDLLSPIYTTATRGGCWFCHNQCLEQLRLLRKNYPDLWALLLKWDLDSPVLFHPDGHTVHDLDRRFQAEDEGKVPTDRKFRWKMLDEKEDSTS